MDSLFSALRKYRPRENSDPVENFVTEAFAWLLKADPEFSNYFLSSLKVSEDNGFHSFVHGSWSTQCNWNGVFPDMVWESSGENQYAYVFEHKISSHLHSNQLQNYKDYAEKKYKADGYKLILITAHAGQQAQDPNEALCWRDVYLKIETFLKKTKGKSVFAYLLTDFLKLLKDLGLSPHGSFRMEELLGYSPSFHSRMNSLWEACTQDCSRALGAILDSGTHFDCSVSKQNEWGRVGMQLFNEWRPGLFVGALLDPDGHSVSYSNPSKGPDCCIIFDFRESFRHLYDRPDFAEFSKSLEVAFTNNQDGWSFYSHLDDAELEIKNLNHPFYIRKPLVDVLSFGLNESSLQAQASALTQAVKVPLDIIFKNTTFLKYRSSEENKKLVQLTPGLLCQRLNVVLAQSSELSTEIWSRYSKTYYCTKFKYRDNTIVGFNLEIGHDELKFWLFFDPEKNVSVMQTLVSEHAPEMTLIEEGSRMVWVCRDVDCESIAEVYDAIQQMLSALGFDGQLPEQATV